MISKKSAENLLLLLGLCISNVGVETVSGRKCSINLQDDSCPKTETCIFTESQDVGVCECIPGYNRTNDICIKNMENGGIIQDDSHTLAWTFSLLILFAIVIVGVYFVYKLKAIDWIRYKLNQRYNRSYDDVMIGQDDE